jgi:hypothetical protein
MLMKAEPCCKGRPTVAGMNLSPDLMRYFLWAGAITIGALVAVQLAPTIHPTEVLEAANGQCGLYVERVGKNPAP